MNQHLTWEQISDYMIGGASPRYAQHARECSTCRSEIERVQGALLDFRGAVRNWTERMSSVRLETSVIHLDFRRGMYGGNEARAGLSSLAIHAAMVALALFLGSLKPVQKAMKEAVTLIAPAPPVKVAENKGGGGGGARQPEVKKADLPKPRKVYTPPTTQQYQTRLEVPSSLLDVQLTNDPNDIGNVTGLSALNGNGYAGGIGAGVGGGIGNGNGPGAGGGAGGGVGVGVYRPGGAVSNPIPISRPEPQYSEEARKAKWGGTVLLSLVVDETGHTTDIHVIKPLGLGLDEKAIEAVSKWLFKPGMKDGKPVKVYAQIEVTFRLL
jgi:periplasmic protein TonB